MKEKILEILIDKIKATPHDYYPTGIEGIPQSAREITDMGKAFTEWKDLETIVQRQTRYTVKYLLLDLDAPPDLMTLDELFNYWYDNIYKSTDKWNNLK